MNLSVDSSARGPEHPLANSKHEAFARELAKFSSVYDSARAAGYIEGSSFKPNARRLAQNKAIKERVAYLQRVSGVTVAVDSAYVQRKLVEIIEAKIEANEIKVGDQLKAMDILCKIGGFYAPAKIAPTNPEGDTPYDPLAINDDDRVRELEAFFARIKQKSAA